MRLWRMRGFYDGATCGYCGCLPTRHCKKDARYSSDSVGGSSGAGASQSATSPEKWKDEDLGWFPNPKGEYTEFSNSILPKFYLSFWATCPYKERFRRCFVTERKRQWEVREALKAINHKEKKKEETERERTERLNREYNDIDWVGLYNSDKLASLRVDELSLYFSHHKIAFKGKKADKVAIIKAHIGSWCCTLQWSVNNLGSPHSEMYSNK